MVDRDDIGVVMHFQVQSDFLEKQTRDAVASNQAQVEFLRLQRAMRGKVVVHLLLDVLFVVCRRSRAVGLSHDHLGRKLEASDLVSHEVDEAVGAGADFAEKRVPVVENKAFEAEVRLWPNVVALAI